MVHRYKDLNAPPAELLDARWDALKARLLVEQNNHDADIKCYRETTLEALRRIYNDKCASCERDRGEELQVDHYRPKKARSFLENPHYNQPGYYWLTYEWSNLIPLCSKCNGNKSNKFPLRGWTELNRISSLLNPNNIQGYSPYMISWLQQSEVPLMINPETETVPARHFIFNRKAHIVGRTYEGIETINICGLNRKDLIRIRLKIRDKYLSKIETAFVNFSNNKNEDRLKGGLLSIFQDIRDSCHEDSEHSLFHTYIFKYFDYFIDAKLPANLRGLSTRYFNEFKQSGII